MFSRKIAVFLEWRGVTVVIPLEKDALFFRKKLPNQTSLGEMSLQSVANMFVPGSPRKTTVFKRKYHRLSFVRLGKKFQNGYA
jgi:hypothetical protein